MLRVLLPCVLIVLAACSSKSEIETEVSSNDENLPPPVVNLPSPPPANSYEIPEKNPDGTFRVEGLLHNREKYWGQEVTVKGTIIRMSEECDPAKAKKAGTECPEPNLFIKDAADEESVLRIVGYKPELVKRAKIEEQQERSFRGRYQKVAQGFVATEDGLILLDYIDEIGVLIR